MKTAERLGLAALGLAFVAEPSAAQQAGPTMVGTPRVPMRTAGVPPSPYGKDSSDQASPETKRAVAALAKKLGDRDSQVRASAVKSLIAIGTVCVDEGGEKTWPNKACVMAEMNICKKNADPEVVERACEVMAGIQKATTPQKPPEPEPEPRLGGDIVVGPR